MFLDNDTRMIKETVEKFVERELFPLENEVLRRNAANGDAGALSAVEKERLHAIATKLGLWGLDAPTELGGQDLSAVTLAVVKEELGRTCLNFTLRPDSPNLRMLAAVATEAQRQRYLKPYIDGQVECAIAISEPAAGGDPAAMKTRAYFENGNWVINGRKIWISKAKVADFIIVMARVGSGERHEGITAFIVDKGTPGFIIDREVPMIGGWKTYELLFDNCRIPEESVLGKIGQGYEPMQLRLRTRRLEMGSTAIGIGRRALQMLCDHAKQRETFGIKLSDRQAIQWWIADISTRIHACRLMVHDAAEKADRQEDNRHEASMIKVFATEMAYDACDAAMQTLGALGMTIELPLNALWQKARLMRIYEGPSEVHRSTVARRVLGR